MSADFSIIDYNSTTKADLTSKFKDFSNITNLSNIDNWNTRQSKMFMSPSNHRDRFGTNSS